VTAAGRARALRSSRRAGLAAPHANHRFPGAIDVAVGDVIELRRTRACTVPILPRREAGLQSNFQR